MIIYLDVAIIEMGDLDHCKTWFNRPFTLNIPHYYQYQARKYAHQNLEDQKEYRMQVFITNKTWRSQMLTLSKSLKHKILVIVTYIHLLDAVTLS
jgi:hypothetical protein